MGRPPAKTKEKVSDSIEYVLRNLSTAVGGAENIPYLMSILPKDSTGLELLYRGSKHGWECDDFHMRCDNKGRTLTIFRGRTGYVAVGYTSRPWGTGNIYVEDEEAFVCALTKER